ncbi:MAG: hypothetical protein Q9170_007205 [Blastenia crenularia]
MANRDNEDEAAPLLADDDLDHNPETNGDLKKKPRTSRHSPVKDRSARLWQLLRNNVKIFALTALLLGGVIALITFIALHRTPVPDQPTDPICLTPACVVAAAGILENMSPEYKNIDPCQDFNTYVCGGWEQTHDLRPDQESVSSGSVMYEKSQQTLRHLLESPYSQSQSASSSSNSADEVIFGKIQSAYNACIDETTIRSQGSRPLIDVLRRIGHYFPIESSRELHQRISHLSKPWQEAIITEEGTHLTRTVAYLAGLGVDTLVAFDVNADEKDPDSVVLMMSALSKPGLPSKEYYQDNATLASYADTIGQVLEALLREARPLADIDFDGGTLLECSEDLVEAIIQLECELASASPDEEDAEDVTKYYNSRSLTQVQSLLPQILIPQILSALAPRGFMPEKIIVGSPSYLKALSVQLENAKPETIRAYLVWKTVQAYADKVEADALIPLKRFNNQLQGKDPDVKEDRWKTCVRAVDRGLGWMLSKFFIEAAFSKEAKAFGDQIIYDIKDQFIRKLSVAEWMSKDVREVAVEKVHRIVQKIGYPTRSPNVLDASAILQYYQHVHISNTTYFGNSLALAQFDSHRKWSKLGKPTNRDEWLMTAVTVNAYYNPPGNEIVFPAGIMQPPIFHDPSLPPYISYGPFGSISGHELTHAFDSNGRHYDQTGNYTDWWNDGTIKAFKDKAECFVDQYSKFSILDPQGKELHVNGRLTLGENIADAGGLSAAFHAWKAIENKQPAQLLPGLQHFTKEQLFFITYPSLFCGKTRKERAVNLIYKDPHSPSWARIIGTVANSAEKIPSAPPFPPVFLLFSTQYPILLLLRLTHHTPPAPTPTTANRRINITMTRVPTWVLDAAADAVGVEVGFMVCENVGEWWVGDGEAA